MLKNKSMGILFKLSDINEVNNMPLLGTIILGYKNNIMDKITRELRFRK
jgi:hypothetical protein